MYTRCPQCLTIYEIDEDALRASLGIVQCGHCSNRFDALQSLSDDLPNASHATMPWMDAGERVPTLAVAVTPARDDAAPPRGGSRAPLPVGAAARASQPDEVEDWFASLESELAAPVKVKYADAWLAGLVAGPDTASAEDAAASLDQGKNQSATAIDEQPADAQATEVAEGYTTEAPAGATEAAIDEDWAVDDRYAPLLADDAASNPAPVGDSAISEGFQGGLPGDEPASHTIGTVHANSESTDGSGDAAPATEYIDSALDWSAVDEAPVEDFAPARGDEIPRDEPVTNELEAPVRDDTIADGPGAESLSDIGNAAPGDGESPRDDETAPVPDTEAAPSHVYVRPRRHRIGRATLGWAAGCLMLALLLGMQLAWASRVDLFRDPATRPWVAGFCRYLPCHIGPVSDPARLELLSRDIRPDPSTPGALAISATVRNDAGFHQAWPVVVVTLSNLDNQPVAMRRFRPAEYMPDPARRAAGIAPGDTAAIAFEVADPGQNAVSYHIGFE